MMRYRLPLPLFFSGFFLLFIVAVLAFSLTRTAEAATEQPKSGDRLIVVHDGDSESGFLSKAGTIKEALEGAHITLDKNDLVEPGLDETLVASSYDVNIYRARPVTIVDGAVRTKVMSAYRTPAQIARHAGMEFRDEDRATTSMPVGGAVQLTIDRATPLTLILYGKKMTVYTQEVTVGEMLAKKGVTMGADDRLSVEKTALITTNMTVELWRDGIQTITEDVAIPFETERIFDADRAVGYKEVKTPGIDGQRTVTYEVEMKNGQEISRKEIQSITVKEPSKQVEVVGVKSTSPTENEALAWNFFIGQGFSRNQTAGIMGNLMQEHGFRTDGDGIAQWTGSRKAALMARTDPHSIQTQLDFLMSELNGGYSKVKANILASSTVEQAVSIFQNQYERCGVCAESRRVQFAYEILGRH